MLVSKVKPKQTN